MFGTFAAFVGLSPDDAGGGQLPTYLEALCKKVEIIL
jgi:hypothetical protein